MSPERRLLKLSRPALTLLTLAVGAGFFAGALFSAQAILLSGVVNRVFRLGQTLADVLPLLGLMLALLLLLLALVGGRAEALTERRFLELSWMSAFFLDVLQGIATLKMFGRSQEQAATIEEISRHCGKTTMEVLATAFQTSLMMEWAATAATAMVALEVSLRLAIARAILKAAPILILDEATSYLDALTEERLMQSLEPFMAGRTTLIISHRRAGFRHGDQLIELNA